MVVLRSKIKETTTNKKKRSRPNDHNTLPSPKRSKHRPTIQPIPCHQCIRKDKSLMVKCKNQIGDNPCVLHFCEKCLMKSYGDKVEEIALSNGWKCPKCRDICICYKCRKQRVQKPVEHTVTEMIQVKGKKPIALNQEIRVSRRMLAKDSSLGQTDGSNMKRSSKAIRVSPRIQLSSLGQTDSSNATLSKSNKEVRVSPSIQASSLGQTDSSNVKRSSKVNVLTFKDSQEIRVSPRIRASSLGQTNGANVRRSSKEIRVSPKIQASSLGQTAGSNVKLPCKEIRVSPRIQASSLGQTDGSNVKLSSKEIRVSPRILAKSSSSGQIDSTNVKVSNKEIKGSPRKRAKSSSFGKIDEADVKPPTAILLSDDDERVTKKSRIEGLKELSRDNQDHSVWSNQSSPKSRAKVPEQVSQSDREMKVQDKTGLGVSLEEIDNEIQQIEDSGNNQDVEMLDRDCEEGDNANKANTKAYLNPHGIKECSNNVVIEQTDTDVVDIEIPPPPHEGNAFQRHVSRFFRWVIGYN